MVNVLTTGFGEFEFPALFDIYIGNCVLNFLSLFDGQRGEKVRENYTRRLRVDCITNVPSLWSKRSIMQTSM